MIDFKKNPLVNEEVYTCLTRIIKNKSFANGYIFYGAEGVGKKQTALNFINEIFKLSSPIRNSFEGIKNNNHPDLLIIKPSSLLEAISNAFDLSITPSCFPSESTTLN